MDLLAPCQALLHGNQQSADLPLKGLYAGRHQLQAGVGGKGLSSEPIINIIAARFDKH